MRPSKQQWKQSVLALVAQYNLTPGQDDEIRALCDRYLASLDKFTAARANATYGFTMVAIMDYLGSTDWLAQFASEEGTMLHVLVASFIVAVTIFAATKIMEMTGISSMITGRPHLTGKELYAIAQLRHAVERSNHPQGPVDFINQKIELEHDNLNFRAEKMKTSGYKVKVKLAFMLTLLLRAMNVPTMVRPALFMALCFKSYNPLYEKPEYNHARRIAGDLRPSIPTDQEVMADTVTMMQNRR